MARADQPQVAKETTTAKASTAKDLAAKQEDYELQQMLVDTLDQVQRNYVHEVSRRKLVEAAIKGIMSELDPYSNYISPEEMDHFRTVVESEFGGIGLQVLVRSGDLKVASPMVGTPAYRAGIVAGDWIVEIEGKSAKGITPEEAVRRLKGKPGTPVSLTVIHQGQTNKEKITVVREIIHVDTVLGDHRKPNDQWDFMLDRQKKIGYVRLTGFSRETANDLHRALEELKHENVRGLVLDLRFNPGGLLSSAIEVSRLFISEGRIVSVVGRNTSPKEWNAEKGKSYQGFPMVILVNHYSASASEIVSACLQDHKRAIVIGERTWGKGSVQNVIPFSEVSPEAGDSASDQHAAARSALKLTTAGYQRPSGKNIDRKPGAKDSDAWGVMPDAGFEIKLNDDELISLQMDRRERDLILPKKASQTVVVPAKQTPPAALASGQTPDKPAAAKPEKPAAKTAKNASAKPPASHSAGTKVGPKASSQASSASSSKSAESSPPVVDRQLQKAIEYLTTEMARSK